MVSVKQISKFVCYRYVKYKETDEFLSTGRNDGGGSRLQRPAEKKVLGGLNLKLALLRIQEKRGIQVGDFGR